MRDAAEKHGPRLRWIASGVAALAACLVLVLGLRWYQAYSTVYSSVYLYINPEVRLDLNSRGTVVELEGLNEDGRQLLDGYSGKGKDKVTVSDELIDRAIAMGFLSEGGVVVISLDTPDEQLFQEYGVDLRTQVSAFLEDRLSVTLEVIPYRGDPGRRARRGARPPPRLRRRSPPRRPLRPPRHPRLRRYRRLHRHRRQQPPRQRIRAIPAMAIRHTAIPAMGNPPPPMCRRPRSRRRMPAGIPAMRRPRLIRNRRRIRAMRRRPPNRRGIPAMRQLPPIRSRRRAIPGMRRRGIPPMMKMIKKFFLLPRFPEIHCVFYE